MRLRVDKQDRAVRQTDAAPLTFVSLDGVTHIQPRQFCEDRFLGREPGGLNVGQMRGLFLGGLSLQRPLAITLLRRPEQHDQQRHRGHRQCGDRPARALSPRQITFSHPLHGDLHVGMPRPAMPARCGPRLEQESLCATQNAGQLRLVSRRHVIGGQPVHPLIGKRRRRQCLGNLPLQIELF